MRKIFRKIHEKIKDWWQIKIKLAIAEFLNKHTSACWSSLVNWAFGYKPLSEVLVEGDSRCALEARNPNGPGCCYCGRYINSKMGMSALEMKNSIDVNPDKSDDPPF